MNRNSIAVSELPSMVSRHIAGDIRQLVKARDIMDEAGGVVPILEKIANGTKHNQIARKLGVSLMQLNAYLKANCSADDIEAATVSQMRTRAENLDDDADDIEDPKKRFDAKFQVLEWQADKETLYYKDKVKDNTGQAIVIGIDWSILNNKGLLPAPMVEVVTNG